MKKAYLINFDKPLPEKVIEEVEKNYEDIDELIVVNKKVTIDLRKKNIYIQCIDIRRSIEKEYPTIFTEDNAIIVNPPGFAIAAIYLINEIEARLKTKPYILELIKNKDSNHLFSQFEFRRVLSLEYNKNVSRTKEED